MAKHRRHTTSYNKQMQEIARKYREEFGDEMNLDAMFDWATSSQNRLYTQKPTSLRKQFKVEMSRALGREMKLDPQGREVKANHAFRKRLDDGQLEWDWAPIETIEPKHMKVSLTLRRDTIASTVIQHSIDMKSYNDNNVHGAELTLFDYNFNLDIEEDQQPEDWDDNDPDGASSYPFPNA